MEELEVKWHWMCQSWLQGQRSKTTQLLHIPRQPGLLLWPVYTYLKVYWVKAIKNSGSSKLETFTEHWLSARCYAKFPTFLGLNLHSGRNDYYLHFPIVVIRHRAGKWHRASQWKDLDLNLMCPERVYLQGLEPDAAPGWGGLSGMWSISSLPTHAHRPALS